MAITALPIPPQRSDPTNFADRADAFLTALPTFGTEANELQADVNAKQLIATEQATLATTNGAAQVALAAAQVALATTQANLATTNGAAQVALAAAQVDLAETAANIAKGSANYKGEYSVGVTYLMGESASYNGVAFVAKKTNTGITPVSGADWFEIIAGSEVIRSPTVISPVQGATGVLRLPTLSASTYSPLYSVDARSVREFQVTTQADVTYATPVFTASVNSDSVAVSTNLPIGTQLRWRCRDKSTNNEYSDWSVDVVFTTTSTFVNTPTLTVVGSPSSVKERAVITTAAFSTTPIGQDTHLSTSWTVRLNSDNTIVHQSLNNTSALLSYTLPLGVLLEGTAYQFQAQHSGTVYGASDVGVVTATTLASFFDIGSDIDGLSVLTTIQPEYSPSTTYALDAVVVVKVKGLQIIEYKSLANGNVGNTPSTSPTKWAVTFDNKTSTSGYLGEVAASSLVIDKGEWKSTATYAVGDMVVVKTGAGSTQDDLTAYVSLSAGNLNFSPSTNPAKWQQRNALPTGSSLVDALGIWNVTPSVKINNGSGWLKFVHKGEVKYIAKKPFLHTVSWDDIAKADCVYGDRTIRIGSRLFKVSLLSGAEANPTSWTTTSTGVDNKGATSEWNELVYRVNVNVPTASAAVNEGGIQVGGNWAAFTNAEMVMTSADGSGSYTWCKETVAATPSYRVFRGGVSLSYFNFNTSSGAAANGGFRPCLTLISEPQASSKLYGAEATGAGPSVASLQYDPITDTGFYGEVSTTDLYTGSGISTAIGLTAGVLQFDTTPWLKFYWHGQVLFVAKKPYRNNLSWDNINTANAVYGVNLGAAGRTRLTKGVNQYDVKLLKGATADPAPASGEGRQWNELIYRVAAEVPATQVGANWAAYTSADMQITGDGSYCWMQEVYAPTPSYRVLRGGASLSYFTVYTSSGAGTFYGFRPCLALVK